VRRPRGGATDASCVGRLSAWWRRSGVVAERRRLAAPLRRRSGRHRGDPL